MNKTELSEVSVQLSNVAQTVRSNRTAAALSQKFSTKTRTLEIA